MKKKPKNPKTSFSLTLDQWDGIEKRMKELGIRKRSTYIQLLIENDVKRGGPLTLGAVKL